MKHFVCFCVSTGSSPNTSLLSDQKGLWYTAPVLCHTVQCLLGNNLTSCAQHIQAMSREEGGRRGKKKWRQEGERQRVMGQRGEGEVRLGGGGPQSIQQSCLYHVIACQLRFRNEACERSSRATVQSMLWKCLPRRHWRASHSSTKYKPPFCEWVVRMTPALSWSETLKRH